MNDKSDLRYLVFQLKGSAGELLERIVFRQCLVDGDLVNCLISAEASGLSFNGVSLKGALNNVLFYLSMSRYAKLIWDYGFSSFNMNGVDKLEMDYSEYLVSDYDGDDKFLSTLDSTIIVDEYVDGLKYYGFLSRFDYGYFKDRFNLVANRLIDFDLSYGWHILESNLGDVFYHYD